MHELSIIHSLLDQLEQICREHGRYSISQVDLRVGCLEHIHPDTLQFMFDQVKVGTILEKATLNLIMEPTKVRCRNCGNEFEPQDGVWLCDRCGSIGGEIVQGTDIVLESVYFEDEF